MTLTSSSSSSSATLRRWRRLGRLGPGSASSKWRSSPEMPRAMPTAQLVARRDHTATLLSNGKVLIVGWLPTQQSSTTRRRTLLLPQETPG